MCISDRKLLLECQVHKHITKVESKRDFKKVQYGGCTNPCGLPLDCGHFCKRNCHPSNDPEHKNHDCKEQCKR